MSAFKFNPVESSRHTRTQAVGRCSDAAAVCDFPADPCLRLNFHDASLEMVLNYMRDAAGFILRIRPNVELGRKLDICNDSPLKKEDALKLVKQALDARGYTAIRDGRMLTIIRSEDAKKNYIPIRVTVNHAEPAGSMPASDRPTGLC